jgi:hypothetical protein
MDVSSPWSALTANAALGSLNEVVRAAAVSDECAYARVEIAKKNDSPARHASEVAIRSEIERNFLGLRRLRVALEQAVSRNDVEAAREAYVRVLLRVQHAMQLDSEAATLVGDSGEKGQVHEASPAAVFSWPPPEPTAMKAVPLAEAVGSAGTVGEAADGLQRKLDRANNLEHAFFPLPDGGFALATRPQSFGDDGKSSEDPLAQNSPPSYLSFEYFRRLLYGHVGRYRVWLIAITGDAPFLNAAPQGTAIRSWATRGMPVLPSSIGTQPLNPAWHCVILLYELYQPSAEAETQVIRSDAKQGSGLSLPKHLEGAGLKFALAPSQQAGG